MSGADVNKFVATIETVKQDYTCGVCSNLCKDPVTLSKCFHIICAEHFQGLKNCPTCNTSLIGCHTYTDDRLGSCIESIQELSKIFEGYKKKDGSFKGLEGGIVQAPAERNDDKNESINVHESDDVVPLKKLGKKFEGEINDTVQLENTIEPFKELDKKPRGKKNKDTITKSTINKSMQKTAKKNSDSPAIVKESKPDFKKSILSDKTNESKPDLNKSSANISLRSSDSRINKVIEKRNNKGETLLHTACRLGKVDQISELLKKGANTNTKDNAGWTPLHEVVQNGRLDLVRLLLQYNTLINVPGQSNETPLHEAVRYDHKDIAEELVKHGADMNARNCKGETPFQLAPSDMKNVLLAASDNIVQTQSLNISRMSQLHSELGLDDIRVFSVSEFRTVLNKLKTLTKTHSNLHIEPKLTKKVTHLIVDADDSHVCESSLDVLQGIVGSLWILSSEWVTKSNEDKLEPFEDYEIVGIGNKSNQGPKSARLNKYKQLPGIFDGCHFYLHNFTTKYEITKKIVVTKAILQKLINEAGGVVLRRVPNPELIPETEKLVPYHAKKGGKLVNCSHYIIFKDKYEPMYNMQHLKALCVGWLIECLEKYELCEPW